MSNSILHPPAANGQAQPGQRPQLMRAGPQGCNQVAGSFTEQLARAFLPRPKPYSRCRLERLLATLEAFQADMLKALGLSPGDREGGR